MSSQRHEVQPDVYCRRLGLQVPLAVSVKNGAMAEVFETICSIAMNPYVPPPSPTPRVLTGVVQLLSEQLSLLHHHATRGLVLVPATVTRRCLGVLIGLYLQLRG